MYEHLVGSWYRRYSIVGRNLRLLLLLATAVGVSVDPIPTFGGQPTPTFGGQPTSILLAWYSYRVLRKNPLHSLSKK